MKISLKQLKIFVEIAKSKSVSLAAEKCFVSQPAASKSLALLEEYLNTSLFKRTADKTMELTNDGYAIFTKANNILNQASEIEALEIDDDKISGVITIGASTTIANYALPKLIPVFQKEFPNIDITLLTDCSDNVKKAVEHFRCDIGFVEGKPVSDYIDYELWREDELKIICSKNNSLAKKKTITIDEALNAPWAMWQQGAGARNIIVENLESQSEMAKTWLMGGKSVDMDIFTFSNVDFGETSRLAKGEGIMNRVITLDNPEAIKNYVANSDALGCLSETAIKNAPSKDISILNIQNSSQNKHFYRVLNKEKYHSKVVLLFADWIMKHTEV